MDLKQALLVQGRSVGCGGTVPTRTISLVSITENESRACRIILKTLLMSHSLRWAAVAPHDSVMPLNITVLLLGVWVDILD